MPSIPPTTESGPDRWLIYLLTEFQRNQGEVNKSLGEANKETHRAIEGLAKRLNTLERRVDRLYTILYLAVPIFQIIGNLGIGLFVKFSGD